MRMTRAGAGALLCLATCGLAGAPSVALAETPAPPIGGSMLAGHGVVVSPLVGMPPLPTGLTASSWLVADADTAEVLAAKAPHIRYLPASTLKTLTALTLIPRLDPHQMVKATYDDAVVDGSKVGLVPGMRYPVGTLFKAMLVVSGNDAADALADAAGGQRHTVALMNGVARHLQAGDTLARTPSGLDAPGESTSAYDLALIARAGLQLPDFRRYFGTVKGRIAAPHHKHFQIYTHNHLLTSYRGMVGGKNGYTVAAHATYVGVATRGGHTLIVTLMHAQPYFWDEARYLLNWGFAARGHVSPIGQLVDPVEPTELTTQNASGPAPTTRHTVVLASNHKGTIAVWQLAVLAGSAAVAVVVTTRRQRRRNAGRLTLPPL